MSSKANLSEAPQGLARQTEAKRGEACIEKTRHTWSGAKRSGAKRRTRNDVFRRLKWSEASIKKRRRASRVVRRSKAKRDSGNALCVERGEARRSEACIETRQHARSEAKRREETRSVY